ncbi:Glycosyltransferase involved in cell wall bisynthesis [Pseudobutyrivibrio sp. ACV-2]|uniref:glycosyltransferase family 4 protein n=1 Tax=Pseudobutyrivibrio sp. ACV-2 TaxID=1520801 RepID=UPI00089BC76E|nr:glycosyltransferase family 4 protein [Pseudobutyrivibrio sp. ACV-2]SEA02089.1 Glycosyltransferase involved in cell wall bisynthesis [Pseudobutyrivibrio sp. ACV-2]
MKVLNLLTSGEAGGIESLCRDIGLNSEYDNGFCFLFSEGSIHDQMRELGLKTYSLANIKGKINIKRLIQLRKIVKNYDIVTVHHGDPFLKLYWLLATLGTKTKKVTVAHSCYDRKYFFTKSKMKFYFAHFMFRVSLNASDLIIFVSNAGKESYEEEFGLSNKRKCVVYNGISMDKLECGKEHSIPTDKPYKITYIGRLNYVKGIDYLVRAVGLIKDKFPISVSLVGDGPERKNLEELVNHLGLGDIIKFEGRYPDVIPFLKETSIFVYPSVWKEVFGISLVEAMSFGIPCIANRVGGIPEILKDGENGFLTNKISDEALAEAISFTLGILSDKEKVENMSANAKKTASIFSIKNTCTRLKEEYSKLMYI